MNALLNRLMLWQRFVILGLFGTVLVSVPFVLYVHESGKVLRAAKLETQAIVPVRLALKSLQLAQQHRGLSALALAGKEEALLKRAVKMEEVDNAFVALDSYLLNNLKDAKISSAWQQTRNSWSTLEGKVSQKSISVADSFSEHTAMISQLFKIKALLLEHYGLIFDPEVESYYLIDAALVQSPMLAEMFGRMRAKGAGLLAAKDATVEDRMIILALIDKANDRYQGLNDALESVTATNQSLKARLAEPGQAALDTATKAIQLAQSEIVKAEQLQFSSSDYVSKFTIAIDAQFKLNEVALTELEDMLNIRAARLTNISIVLSVSVLLLALLAALIGTLITRGLLKQLGGEPDYVAGIAGKIATGDLAMVIDTKANDQTSLLVAMKTMRDSLVNIVGQVRTGTDTIATASSQIATGNLDLSSRTEEQASALQETASSMEELTSTVKQNADNARQANQLAQSASEVAIQGGAVVSQVVNTMGSINESSKKIVDIIGVIDGIAFQTNILALNAAVEAARAGEQGRGFAVVASEVRNLAQRSAAAAKEIKTLIGASVEKVNVGSKLVDQAGSTMDEVVASVKRVTDIIGEITAASNEQTSGIEQINQAIMQMDDVTQQNAALVEEAAAAAQSMQGQAENLSRVVSVFKLADGAASIAPLRASPSRPSAPTGRTSRNTSSAKKLGITKSASIAISRPAIKTDEWEEF